MASWWMDKYYGSSSVNTKPNNLGKIPIWPWEKKIFIFFQTRKCLTNSIICGENLQIIFWATINFQTNYQGYTLLLFHFFKNCPVMA